MASAAPATLRADAARNRELVLDAAERLFAERGLDVSMQEIAEAAGVGVGTVFRRFESKEQLVATIVEQRVGELLVLAQAALERSADEPWEAFAGYVVAGVELHVRHRGFMEAVATSDLAPVLHAAGHDEIVVVMTQLVRRAQDAGALRADARAEDLPLLLCAISRSACHAFSSLEPDVWRRHCTLVLDGLRAPAAVTPLAPDMPRFGDLLQSLS